MAAGGAPTDPNAGVISLDQVKKNYRRLSLKHHPDRKTGDAECFRMLNRAKIVLSSPKLRREYDLVGLDLEDDAEDHDHEDDHNTNDATNNGAATASTTENGEGGGEAHHEDSAKDGNQNKTETVMGHLASATLAAVLQVVVRTALMGLVSVLISRYTILVRYYWELYSLFNVIGFGWAQVNTNKLVLCQSCVSYIPCVLTPLFGIFHQCIKHPKFNTQIHTHIHVLTDIFGNDHASIPNIQNVFHTQTTTWSQCQTNIGNFERCVIAVGNCLWNILHVSWTTICSCHTRS